MNASQKPCNSNSVTLCWWINKRHDTNINDNFCNSSLKLLYLTTNSVSNKSSHLIFNIHASLNKSFTCKTNRHINPKGSKNIADIFKIFPFVTGNDSAISIISENAKINSSLVMSHSTAKTFLMQLSELTSQEISFICLCKFLN